MSTNESQWHMWILFKLIMFMKRKFINIIDDDLVSLKKLPRELSFIKPRGLFFIFLRKNKKVTFYDQTQFFTFLYFLFFYENYQLVLI